MLERYGIFTVATTCLSYYFILFTLTADGRIHPERYPPNYSTYICCWYSFLFFMWKWAYILASRTGPGSSWNILVSKTGGFCQHCGIQRVARSHHCSRCGTCSLKMDHHCPWVSNCVGFYNYKCFVLFTFYLSFGAFTYMYCLYKYITVTWMEYGDSYSGGIIGMLVFWVENFFVFLTFFVVPMLFLTHVALISSNLSTVEYMKGIPFNHPCYEMPGEPNPHFMGLISNWAQVLGTNPAYWLIPSVCDTWPEFIPTIPS